MHVLEAIYEVMPGKERGILKRKMNRFEHLMEWCPLENNGHWFQTIQDALLELSSYEPQEDWEFTARAILNGTLDYREYMRKGPL